jgi:tungstate transport system permease protein
MMLTNIQITELINSVGTSLEVSIAAIIIAGLIGVPLAAAIALMPAGLKKIISAVLNSLLAVPTVAIALLVYLFICRLGPFGGYNLLFTPWAIVIGQTILAIPIIATIMLTGLNKTEPLFYETLFTLGANKFNILQALIKENIPLIVAAMLLGFSRVVSEIGIAMMLGGNIRWYTRTITTALALETSRGEFYLAIALGLILVVIAILVNFCAALVRKVNV